MKRVFFVISLAGLVFFLAGCSLNSNTSAQLQTNVNNEQDATLPLANQNQNVNEAPINQSKETSNKTSTNQTLASTTQASTTQASNLTANWKSYNSSSFSIKYPTFLSQETKQDESPVTSMVSFQGTAPQSNYDSLLSIEQMVNQGGLTLTDWTNEIISQSGWVKQGSVKISGQTAFALILPESDAGTRYFFLSKDNQTMFIITIQHFDRATTDLIYSSFVLKK